MLHTALKPEFAFTSPLDSLPYLSKWSSNSIKVFDGRAHSHTAAKCPASDVTLNVPKPKDSECIELIRNCAMERHTDSSVPLWLQHSSLLEVAKGRGRRGSTAIAEVDVHTPYGFLAQYIDVRCLTQGKT